jgi:RND family efflux transporter MFP subunit
MLFLAHRLCRWAFILCLCTLISCISGEEFNQVITFPVTRSDFRDVVTVSGTLEAVNTRSYGCPGIWEDITIQYLIEEGSHVVPGDTLCILKVRKIENDYLQAVNELENTRAEYNKSVAELELQFLILEAQAKTIDATTKITQLDSLQYAFTSPSSQKIIKLELEKAELERNITLKKLEFLRLINQSELEKMSLKIDQFENRVDQARAKMDKLTLISDIEGIVVFDKLWTSGKKVREGDIVWGNMPIMQIPDLSEMQVKLCVCESDYRRIVKDQEFELTVDAFPEIVLSGRIKNKAPVGKAVHKDSEVKLFDVTASLDSSSLNIQPGLGVSCNILVRSLPDTIVVPVISLFKDDSLQFVYVAENERFRRSIVSVATSNHKEAIIEKGLHGDEILALVKPPESLINQ